MRSTAARRTLIALLVATAGAACANDALNGAPKSPSQPASEEPRAAVVLLPRFFDFGVTVPGASDTSTVVRVMNSGNVPWTLRAVVLSAGPFSAAPVLGEVAPGDETTITVTFRPGAEGSFEATGTLSFDLDLGVVTFGLAAVVQGEPEPPPPDHCEGSNCFPVCTDCGPIYAHSGTVLYSVDPDSLALSVVAPFDWPSFFPYTLTDLAESAAGELYGVSDNTLWRVDRTNARLTEVDLVETSLRLNGLSFIRRAGVEELMASSADGDVFRIDRASATIRWTGSLGRSLKSHGDLVYSDALGIIAAVGASDESDSILVHLDPTTGAATDIATLPGHVVFGMALFEERIYAFTEAGRLLLIDPTTGVILENRSTPVTWYGAATPPT